MPEKTMNVFEKVSKARTLLQKKALKKSGENKYAGFRYFELADFLPSVNEIFTGLGLCAHFYIEDEHIEDIGSGGEPYYIQMPAKAHLNIINTESPNEVMRFSSGVADAAMKGASPIQQLGSVHTYMRRYLYLEALEISECDGVDSLNQEEQIEHKKVEKKAPKIARISPEQVQRILDLFNGDDARMHKMMDVYQVEALEQLNANQAANIIRRMEGNRS